MNPFDLHRFYVPDDSFPGFYAVYEDDLFLCTGLTLDQAKDFCVGANLLDMSITQLMF